MTGKIIVIEGSDGAGKKTQTERLVTRLIENGHRTTSFSFPNYAGFFGKTTRDYLTEVYGNPLNLGIGEKDIADISMKLESVPKKDILQEITALAVQSHTMFGSLLYVLDRTKSIPDLRKAIAENEFVVGDRWDFSNWAHQGAKLPKDFRWKWIEWLRKAEREELGFPAPDISFYLNLPIDYRLEAMKGRADLDMHESNVPYQRKVEDLYLEIALKERWRVINCLKNGVERKTVDEIAEEIWTEIAA